MTEGSTSPADSDVGMLPASPNPSLFSLLNGYRTSKLLMASNPEQDAIAPSPVVGSEDVYRHRCHLALSLPPPIPSEALTNAEDLTEIDSVGGSQPEMATSLLRDDQVAELEKRVLHNAKTINLRDLLMTKPQKRPLVVLLSEPDEDIMILDTQTKLPQPAISKASTHKITLKLTPEALMLITEPNPLKVKGSGPICGGGGGGESILALMMRRPRKRHMVTLKVNSAALKQVADSANPLKVKGTGPRSLLALIFALMMKSLADSAIKKTALQKLTELLPPPITRDQLHVIGDDLTLPHLPLPLPLRDPVPILVDDDDDEVFSFPQLSQLDPARFNYTAYKQTNLAQLVQERIPDIRHHPCLMAIFNRFINRFTAKSTDGDNDELWVNKYAPHRMEELLVAEHPRHTIKAAICSAFERLKSLSLRKPRNELIIERRRREQKRLALLGGFVVDDYGTGNEQLTDDDDDIFLPIIIIHGRVGVGKSTAVYTAMRELKGHVHEINTGMARGRRDINTTLKEYCTTHTVHRKDGKTASFKQGLVLLEDTHILFEQDRTFWQLVTEMVNILRRPIVITCELLDNIPRQLIEYASEENAVIDMEFVTDFKLVEQYLWLCGACEGYDVDSSVLRAVIDNAHTSHFDLRWALMTLQLVCLSSKRKPGKLVSVEHGWSLPPQPIPEDLGGLHQWLELALASDVIDTNMLSLYPHQPQVNELVDIYVIPEPKLRPSVTDTELNIGHHLATTLGCDRHPSVPTFGSINHIREPTNDFIGLRQRRTPKFMEGFFVARKTRSLTPDDQSFDFDLAYANAADTTGVADSLCLWWTPNSAYITDILPVATDWVRFQQFVASNDIPDHYRRFRLDGINLFDFSHCPDRA